MPHPATRLAVIGCLMLGATCAAAVDRGPATGPVNPSDYKDKIRVACVGDSITFGSGVKDRETNNYPAQLGRMLGEKWEVRNFGVSGATMLRKGDKPYDKQKAFRSEERRVGKSGDLGGRRMIKRESRIG